MQNDYATMYLDGLLLPDYGNLREVTNENASKNYTLDGQLYVDYLNNRRVWVISWKLLTRAQYNLIRAKYDKQFEEETMLNLIIDNLGIFTTVYMTINDKKVKWNGQYVEGFEITLEEQHAIS